jgi:hypothetical protein
MREKYGNGFARPAGPLALAPAPDEGVIRTALQHLHDPEQRLVNEFFWFWPAQLGQGKTDKSLRALATGKIKAAFEAWSHAERNSSDSNVSMHNIAVLTHTMALDYEFSSRSRRLDENETKQRNYAWGHAFKRWRVLLEYEGFWSRLSARIRDLSDPRLTAGTARRFRACLPFALLSINAQLAVRAAEKGKRSEAARHVKIIQQSGFQESVINEVLRRAVGPIRQRIKLACQAAEASTEAQPEHGDQAAYRLLEHTRPLLPVLDSILGNGHPTRDGAYDEVALCAMHSQVAFGNKTENWDVSLQLLRQALPVAVGQSVRSRIEENVRIVEGNIEYRRTAGTCWFCQKRPPDDSAKCDVPMHGNVQRMWIPNGTRITWEKMTVKVPRCKTCQAAHANVNAMIGLIGCLPAVVVAILVAIIAGAAGAKDAGVFVPALVALGVIGVAGCGIATAVNESKLKRQGIKSESAKNEFAVVKEMKAKGWSLGEKPATA